MARPERPLDLAMPVGCSGSRRTANFVSCGPLTYRDIARGSGYPVTALSEGRRRLPARLPDFPADRPVTGGLDSRFPPST